MKPYWQHIIKKYISIVIIVSFLLLLFNNWVAAKTRPKLSLMPIEKIKIQEPIFSDQITVVEISGYLSDSCCSFHSLEINYDEERREVIITLWQSKIHDACLHVIEKFHTNVFVIFPFSAQWNVRCNNKNISVYVY